MTIEKNIVEQGLKDREINIALADNLSFETEEQMNTTLDDLKQRTYGTIEDVLKDEKLSTIVRNYGDKRLSDLQSKIDKEKLHKDDKIVPDKKDEPEDKKKDEEPEWAKKMREDNEKILSKLRIEDFNKLVKKLGSDLSDVHLNRIKKGLKPDATEAEITAEITAYKKELADIGIKEFGTPGSGNKGGVKAGAASKEWLEKQKKKIKK